MTDQGGKVFRQSGVSGAQTRDFRHEKNVKFVEGFNLHNIFYY